MPLSEIPRIGLLFTSFVEFIVAISALALIIFLLRRWKSSDSSMKAYVIFWLLTFFVWTTSMIRYLFVSFGYENSFFEYLLSVVTQLFIFSGGPVLFYFVSKRTICVTSYVTFFSVIPSFLLTIVSFIWLLGFRDVTTIQITYFSADSVISNRLFYIFGFEIIFLLLLLTRDTVLRFRMWRRDKVFIEKYRALHSLALVVYLIIGTIDQAKIFVGWPLVVFRALYSASFLFVYVVMSHDDGGLEQYLIIKEYARSKNQSL